MQPHHGGEAAQIADTLPEFYIPATESLAERRPRTIKHGDLFALFDRFGDIFSTADSPDGLFYRDTRYLSQYRLTLNGRRPLLLSSTVQDDNAALVCDLTNPDLLAGDGPVLPRDTIHIGRSKVLWNGCCYERLLIRNFDAVPHRLVLTLRFGADFADLFEVRGHRRARRGAHSTGELSDRAVGLRYVGLDGVERRTELHFDPAPSMLDSTTATYDLTLSPEERAAVFVAVCCDCRPRMEGRRQGFFAAVAERRRAQRAVAARSARVISGNTIFNEAWRRAVADLQMLVTETPEGPYPYAGIPWFSTAFGRDGIITAVLMLWLDPAIARGVLHCLAANQATAEDAKADAEPGKILHETRSGEMARLGEVPFGKYYGSVDSTPLFVMLAGAYYDRTGDLATIESLWPNIEAALGWIDQYGDQDGDGFVEYGRKSETGLVNQGWKDSHDSIFHADGTLARGSIALVEVQGYVYAAKSAAARLSRALGRPDHAAALAAQAETLQRRFEETFWCEDLQTYALALDGGKRPCRVRSSNAGHALFTGIAAPERAEKVAATLLSGDSFSGWGIRTIATGETRYNPMSYHNGSVWPHDNALIALGLTRYGLHEAVTRIFEGLFDAAIHMELRRLPELFCGFVRRRGRNPTSYPVACSPQAWASAAPMALLQAALGLEFDHAARTIRLIRPLLPDVLEEVRLHGLRLGDAATDLLLRRQAGGVTVTVLERRGNLRVVTVN